MELVNCRLFATQQPPERSAEALECAKSLDSFTRTDAPCSGCPVFTMLKRFYANSLSHTITSDRKQEQGEREAGLSLLRCTLCRSMLLTGCKVATDRPTLERANRSATPSEIQNQSTQMQVLSAGPKANGGRRGMKRRLLATRGGGRLKKRVKTRPSLRLPSKYDDANAACLRSRVVVS